MIRSNWRIDGGTFTLNAAVRPNTTATVYIPKTEPRSLRESGSRLTEAAGVKRLRNENGMEYTSAQATIWRWREAFQHDFAARMDWCVAETFDAANHNPAAAFDNDKTKAIVNVTVKPGDTVKLSAAGTSDPDGDNVSYKWFVYREAGDYNGGIEIENSNTPKASFIAPETKRTANVHVILEVEDDGQPNLYGYRRIIVTVEP